MVGESMSERERRDLADAHRDDAVVADSATAVEPRRLGQMASVRLDPDVLVSLRKIANDRGVTVSDLLREGAGLVLASSEQAMQVVHFTFGVQVGETRTSVWDARATPTRSAGSQFFTAV